MNMSYETINTQEAVALFHRFMRPSQQMQMLRLTGDAKMGKSHLLTKVFPSLALRDYQAHCVIIDLRNKTHTVPDFLNCICSHLGSPLYDSYWTTYQAWMNRPKKVGLERLVTFFSHITISTQDNSSDLHQRDIYLTTQFVKDLSKLADRPLLLFFDTVDQATEYIQSWLMDTLLAQLSPLKHIRVVVAGRSLPEACSSYTSFCQSYQLLPITEIDAYITYCRRANVLLEDQSIRDFARAFRYTPGIFVDYAIPEFIPQKVLYE